MSSSKGLLATLVAVLVNALTKKPSPGAQPGSPEADGKRPKLRPQGRNSGATSAGSAATAAEPGQSSGSETVQVNPDRITGLQISYSPERDGAPDAGEVIWTWVPYEENDGRGKDRPVLVIGRQSADRVYAVRMTSKPHDGSRDYLSIGSGAWDAQGRESWVDIEQLYSVHDGGIRREAAILDRKRFIRVAEALHRRYGWSA